MTRADDLLWFDSERGLAIRLDHRPTDAAVALLERTLWGGRNLRYRIRDVAAKLERMHDPYVFTVERGGRLAVVCILDRKDVSLLDRSFDAYHFAMIATADSFKGQGLAGMLAGQIRRYLERTLRSPAVGYAYIESTTDYSLRISDRVGHSLEAVMPLTVFSRLWPRDDAAVERLAENDAPGVVARLGRLYEGHGFADVAGSLRPAEYFVLRRGGNIVAGVQAETLHWSVVDMPGWGGVFLMKVLPRLPLLRDMLPVADLRFLRYGNLLVEPGHEGDLVRLLEVVLARRRTRVGLIIMDRRSPVLQRIRAYGRLGPVQPTVTGATKVVADFQGVSEDDIARIAAMPMVMSPRDVF